MGAFLSVAKSYVGAHVCLVWMQVSDRWQVGTANNIVSSQLWHILINRCLEVLHSRSAQKHLCVNEEVVGRPVIVVQEADCPVPFISLMHHTLRACFSFEGVMILICRKLSAWMPPWYLNIYSVMWRMSNNYTSSCLLILWYCRSKVREGVLIFMVN